MPEHTPSPTPSRGVYGFVMYLTFQLFFIIYVVWAVVPEQYFIKIGITFLPKRYWAVTVPIYLLTVLNIFAFVIYPALGLCMTPNVNDLETFKDEVGSRRKDNGKRLKCHTENKSECICKDKNKCYKEYYDSIKGMNAKKAIPKLEDLNVWDVSEKLYL